MPRIYYKYTNDFRNRNKFNDQLEGNNSVSYNSFFSTSSVEFYFKTNDRLETINFGMPDIVPLGLVGKTLKPSSDTVSRLSSDSTTITYNNQGGASTGANITIN